MTTMDICYCVLILAGAFCLVALGVLFIRTSTAIKQTGDTVEMAQDTLKRVDKVLDDVNYKLDLLNAPVETVAKFFDPQRPKFNPLKWWWALLRKIERWDNMKLGRFLTTLGIGALVGMLLAPKKEAS